MSEIIKAMEAASEIKTQDDLNKFISAAQAKLNEIADRVNAQGHVDVVTRDEYAKVEASLQDLAGQIGNIKPMVEAAAKRVATPSDGDFSTLALAEPPKGMAKLHFNLLTRTPEELSYAASVAATAGHRKLLDRVGLSREGESLLAEFKAMSDALYVTDRMMSAANEEYRNISASPLKRMQTLKAWKNYESIATRLKAAAGTALDTATADQGLEWVPTMYSSQVHELMQPELKIAALFERMPMPSATYVSPVMGADMVAYKMAEATEEGATKVTSKTFITKKMTLTSKKLGARIMTSNEMIEDSITPIIPRIIAQTAKALARGIETTILNGDATGAHMDYDTEQLTNPAEKLLNGLRQQALAQSFTTDTSAGDLSIRTHLIAARKGMKVYGANPAQVVYVTGYAGLAELLMAEDDGGANILLTVDKYGPGAVVLTGEVGRILGIPVILSEFVRDDVDNTGANTNGGTNTKTTVYAVNREAYVLGERRAATITRLNEVYAETDQIAFVGTWRGDFQPWYAATEPAVWLLRNVRV